MTKLTVWIRDNGFGISWTATKTDDNCDMTTHGWVACEETEIETSETQALELVNLSSEEIKAAKRAKLVAELEALDNE